MIPFQKTLSLRFPEGTFVEGHLEGEMMEQM